MKPSVLRLPVWRSVGVDHPADVGVARRWAADGAGDGGVGASAALVVTELGTNLLRHARNGRLILGAGLGPGSFEVFSIDDGPGMTDIDELLTDGVSHARTPSLGSGLGAVARHSSRLEIDSGSSTSIFARIAGSREPAPVGFTLTYGDAKVGADCGVVVRSPRRTRIGLFDGLGHGEEARQSAERAVREVVRAGVDLSLVELAERIHTRLRGGRGAVGWMGEIRRRSIRWVGVGDVGAMLVGPHPQTLHSQAGILGLALPELEVRTCEIPADGALVVHTDGVAGPNGRIPDELALSTCLRGRVRREDVGVLYLPVSWLR